MLSVKKAVSGGHFVASLGVAAMGRMRGGSVQRSASLLLLILLLPPPPLLFGIVSVEFENAAVQTSSANQRRGLSPRRGSWSCAVTIQVVLSSGCGMTLGFIARREPKSMGKYAPSLEDTDRRIWWVVDMSTCGPV
jgi:hypothetical protein